MDNEAMELKLAEKIAAIFDNTWEPEDPEIRATQQLISAHDNLIRAGVKAPLYELVDEFHSGASEYDVRGAEHWEQCKAEVYTECADKIKAALDATKADKQK